MLLVAAQPNLRAQVLPPPLKTPEIVRVTVDTMTGLAGIEWKASTSPDIEQYELYYELPIGGENAWFLSDDVDGDTRQYYYPLLDPDERSWSLTALAYDTIGTSSNFTDMHSTMHLSSSYDSCNKTIDLDWTTYQGWGEDYVRNEVYFSVDGGPYLYLGKTDPDTASYLHHEILDNRQYCYFIKAIHPDTWSFSNIACRFISHPIHPAWINAESASAVGTDRVELKFVMDPAGEVTDFQLFKASGPGKPFISDAVFSGVYDSLVHLDPVLSTDTRYQYKLASLDVCGKRTTESNISGNIVLSAIGVGLTATLSWNPYEEYEAGVKNYRIYRDINHSGLLPHRGVHHPDTTYEDDLSFLEAREIEDEICYIIEAKENDSWTRGKQGLSRSNRACVTVVPEIFMANAIIPNSMPPNNQIKPELTFIPERYIYAVYDRWGNRIFETQEHETAWDGRINGGKFVTEGAYAYYIQLTTSNGIEVKKTGVITVFYK